MKKKMEKLKISHNWSSVSIDRLYDLALLSVNSRHEVSSVRQDTKIKPCFEPLKSCLEIEFSWYRCCNKSIWNILLRNFQEFTTYVPHQLIMLLMLIDGNWERNFKLNLCCFPKFTCSDFIFKARCFDPHNRWLQITIVTKNLGEIFYL